MNFQKVLSFSELEEVIQKAANNSQMAILHFSADSSLSVKQRMRYKELAEKYPGMHWLETTQEEGSELIESQGIRSFPTFKIYVNNEEVRKLVGATMDQVEAALMMETIPVALNTDGVYASVSLWGQTTLGEPVHCITIVNATGLDCSFISYGASLQSCKVANKRGVREEITLHCDTMEEIESWGKEYYFGSTIGRVANRICEGLFILDGKEYDLACNDGYHHLNGGHQGFDKHVWDYEIFEAPGEVGVKFSRVSLNGEEGYPGTLNVETIYSISERGSRLKVEYIAEAVTGPTVVDLTNHIYWNLSGNFEEKIGKQELWVNADKYVVIDEEKIPTGEMENVQGTPLNFLVPVALRWRMAKVNGDGIDHCFAVNRRSIRKGDPIQVASISHPENGRRMTVYSTQPGIQVYTGNEFSDSKDFFPYVRHNSICLQPQHFPDSVNDENIPPKIRLDAGEIYNQSTVFEFTIDGDAIMNSNSNASCHACKCF